MSKNGVCTEWVDGGDGWTRTLIKKFEFQTKYFRPKSLFHMFSYYPDKDFYNFKKNEVLNGIFSAEKSV